MSKVQAAQLLARGVQDAWLSGEPQVSFYRSRFKRHAPFALTIERFLVPIDGKILINPKSDLLGYTYLTAHDPTTGALVPNPVWTNIVSTVELVIGNQSIATHDLTYINTIQKVLEADTYSKRSSTTFQPLGFFFDRQALPLVALKYTDVRINITWASVTAATQYMYRCWSHCVHLGEDERRFFATQRHQMLIPQIQRVPVSNEPLLRGPLKYLAAPCVNYPAVYGSWVTRFASSGVVGSGAAHIVQNGISYYATTYTSGPLYLYNSDGSVFPTSLASIGTTDVAVTKIDPSGNIVWCASMGAVGESITVNDIQADATGIYVLGVFAGTMTFNNSDGTPGASLTEIVVGTGGDGFLVKYDLDGNVLWCTKWGLLISTSAVRAWSIKIDSNGLYISGRTISSAAIRFYNSDGSTNTATPIAQHSYVAKYNKSGFLVWRSTQRYGSSVGENYALALDSTRVYISAGIGNTTTTFYNSNDTIGGTLVTTGTQNSYIGAYNATTGNFVWRARIGSTTAGGVFGFIRTADADSSGVYFVGNGIGTINLYNSDGTQSSASVTSAVKYGIMACYDSSGNAKWAVKIENVERINSVTVYNGTVYVNGFFISTQPITFYNADGTQYPYTLLRKGSTRDAYVAAYTTSGQVEWIIQGASTVLASMAQFGVDQSVYFPGVFSGTDMKLYNQTGNSILSPLSLTGTQSAFLYKFQPW